jgi:Ca2+-binding EF-hand superfamily protein
MVRSVRKRKVNNKQISKVLGSNVFNIFNSNRYGEKISEEFSNNFWNSIDTDQNKEISFKEFMFFESLRSNEFYTIEDYVECNYLFFKNIVVFMLYDTNKDEKITKEEIVTFE